MMTDTDIFKNRKVNFNKLIGFGFARSADKYIYSTILPESRFTMVVTVSAYGSCNAVLFDDVDKEEYVLHRVSGAKGSFVGMVRSEYDDVLARINSECFESDIFKSAAMQKIISYAAEKYGSDAEFLWKRFPLDAVLRRNDSNKWYAVLMIVARNKLGLSGEEPIEIIDLRTTAADMEKLIDMKNILPGYHMNKKHWLTVCPDAEIPPDMIFKLIDASYLLAEK